MFASLKQRLYRLLRWSERYTKTDMVYTTRSSFWLSVGYLVNMATTLALALVLANVLTPSVYGTYKYVFSITSVLAIFVLPGIDTAMVQSISRGYEGALKQIFRVRLRWGIIAIIGSLAVASYYLLQDNNILGWSFAVAALGISFIDPLASFSDLLRGRKAFAIDAKLNSIAQIIMTGILVITALIHPAAAPLVGAYYIGWTIVNGILLLYTLKKYPINNKKDPEVISYGKHLTIMKSATVIAGSLGSIILFHLSSVSLAVFSIAVAPIEQVRGLVSNLQSAMLPKFAQDEWHIWSFKQFVQKTWPFFTALIVGIILYWFVSPFLFRVLFPKYLASVYYTKIWAWSLIPTGFITIFLSVLRAKKEVRRMYVFNIITLVATFLFIPVLTYFHGIGGAITGQFIVKGIQTIILILFVWIIPHHLSLEAQEN